MWTTPSSPRPNSSLLFGGIVVVQWSWFISSSCVTVCVCVCVCLLMCVGLYTGSHVVWIVWFFGSARRHACVFYLNAVRCPGLLHLFFLEWISCRFTVNSTGTGKQENWFCFLLKSEWVEVIKRSVSFSLCVSCCASSTAPGFPIRSSLDGFSSLPQPSPQLRLTERVL